MKMKQNNFRVVVTDSNDAFMHNMTRWIKEVQPEAVVTPCKDLDCSLLALLEEPFVQFLIFDLNVLGEDWRSRLEKIIEKIRPTQVILAAQYASAQTILSALKLNIKGFLIKTSTPESIKNALKFMFEGEIYIPTSVYEKADPKDHTAYQLPSGKFLTPRQIEVLGYLGEGKSNKQIAYEMSVSEATVKLHINALLRHLKTSNRTQIVVKAQSLGFL